jgi:hypothetical protein
MTAPVAPRSGRVAELETTLAACRRDNGRLRTRRAQELARNHALTADLHSRDLTIVNLRADIAALHGEKDRLANDLATARATQQGRTL